jgi:Inner membrane protein YgaP-like, transmembrane domain
VKKTVGGIDKWIRIVIGLILILVGIFFPMSTRWRAGVFVVAVIALITAFTGL